MDFNAVQFASDKILEEYGLKAAGQRLSLRWFCQTQNQNSFALAGDNNTESRDARKRRLLEELRNKAKKNATAEKSSKVYPPNHVEKTRKIQLGWMHYNEEKQKYVAVRMASGGGTRDVNIRVNANAKGIIKEAAELFYPNGESLHYGAASSMKLELGNFKGEVVKGAISKGNGDTCPFTLRSYIEINKLSRVRLYLMSKLDNEFMELNDDSSETDEELISYSMFPKDAVDPSLSTPKEKSISFVYENSVQEPISLEEDKEIPEAVKNESITKTDYNKRIQAERASRVLPEPDFTETDDAVIVAVRHVDQGVISRHFRSDQTITAVYDWVGSLQPEPPNFVLCNALSQGQPIDPSKSVRTIAKTMLHMDPRPTGPYLIPDEPEISMVGFNNVSDFDIEEITPAPPVVIFDEDLE